MLGFNKIAVELHHNYPPFCNIEGDNFLDVVESLNKKFREQMNNLPAVEYKEMRISKTDFLCKLDQIFQDIKDIIEYSISNDEKEKKEAANIVYDHFFNREKYNNKRFKESSIFNGGNEPVRFLYRVRREEEGSIFYQNDLFHISYRDRHKASEMRYSLPGIPGLYLANTINLAKCETGINDGDTYYVMGFLMEHPFNILKFIYPSYSKATYSEFDFLKVPFVYASSIKMNDRKKDEYIIPQLLMKGLKRHDEEYNYSSKCQGKTIHIDGIQYLSAHTNKIDKGEGATYNYAFVPTDFDDRGYGKRLQKMFKLTKPFKIKASEIDWCYDQILMEEERCELYKNMKEMDILEIENHNERIAEILHKSKEWENKLSNEYTPSEDMIELGYGVRIAKI